MARSLPVSRTPTILILLIAAIPALPQTAPPRDPLDRDTPQDSVFNFLEACHAKNYERAWKYLDVGSLPEGQRLQNGTELARQLARILDRDVRFDIGGLSREPGGDDRDGLSPDREVVDSFVLNGRPVQIQLLRVSLHSGLKVWLFSAETLALVPKLAVLASDSAIEKHLPPVLVNREFMDTALWRVLTLLLLATGLAAASRWLSRLVVFLADAVLARIVPRLDGRALTSLTAPIRILFPAALFGAALAPVGT